MFGFVAERFVFLGKVGISEKDISMKINDQDLSIHEIEPEGFDKDFAEYFEGKKDAIVLVQDKYLLCGLRYSDSVGNPHWFIASNIGEEELLEFLYRKGLRPGRFTSVRQIEKEVFPLINEFLADKPDDYLEKGYQEVLEAIEEDSEEKDL